MSVTTLTLIVAVLATVLFVSGYVKGILHAIGDFDTRETPGDDKGGNYWATVAVAIFGSFIAVYLLGVTPTWMDIVPIISIGSGAMIGVAFFVE